MMIVVPNRRMSDSFTVKRTKSEMSFFNSGQQEPVAAISESILVKKATNDLYLPILPGLPDDVATHCIGLVPRSEFPSMGAVCKGWRSFMKNKEFLTVRKLAGVLEEWIYYLTIDVEGNKCYWEVLDSLGRKHHQLPAMPGPLKAGFGVAVLNGKLLVISGYSVADGTGSVSPDVYQHDSCLNRWSKLANMNVARYDFACTEVNGMVYVVGGCDIHGVTLSSAEVYNPDTDKWTVIESMRRPRRGCFACSFNGKLYIMGGRSSFTIGNSRFVDIYNPKSHTWAQMKNGCVMVTAHAVVGEKLFCMEWKNERKLTIFNPVDNSWQTVPIPVNGSLSVGFSFGVLDGKLLLFAEKTGNQTLAYDPNAEPGAEWEISEIKPSGLSLCCVTIKA